MLDVFCLFESIHSSMNEYISQVSVSGIAMAEIDNWLIFHIHICILNLPIDGALVGSVIMNQCLKQGYINYAI